MSHEFKFGIEEEYFLADDATGRTPGGKRADAFHEAASRAVQCAEHELLKGQVEVSTEPGTSSEKAADSLLASRTTLARIADDHGLRLFAAGTHPLGFVDDQETTETDRYRRLGDELRLIAPQAAVSAMHVHVEVPDAGARTQLMNRIMPLLPLLYALSVSSPFWAGRKSGLKGYRLTAFAQWPRVGLPETFADQAQFETYVERLKSAGFIEDSSFVWSHIRPSKHYPTIEMRICDSCTYVEDAVAIAALYRAIVRMLTRRDDVFPQFGPIERGLTRVNLWRAQQHGVEAIFADTEQERTISVAALLDATLELVDEDLMALDPVSYRRRLLNIVRDGTSADRQLRECTGDSVSNLRDEIERLSLETRVAA